MHLKAHLLPACLALAATAGAQSFTSPRGFLTVEGDSSHFALFNPGYERFQQIDDTWTGQPVQALRTLSFRRDGALVGQNGGPRTMQLTVDLGEADWNSISGGFASNWVSTPTRVFTPKTVNQPDWSMLAAVTPAPFDFTVPFDTPFNYPGNHAFAFELTIENVAANGSPEVDRELGSSASFNQDFGRSVDFGCLVNGQALEMGHTLFLRNYGPSHPNFGMQFGVGVQYAPVRQNCILNVATTNANLTVPGLCARVHAIPQITIPLGPSDGLGDVPQTFFDFPYFAAAVGVTFVTQALALDPGSTAGIQVALSNDRTATMPAAPRPSPRTAYIYAPFKTTQAATLWRDRGVVVRFAR